MPEIKSILITGASSGIGAALASAYAKPGIFLALTGRSSTRLKQIAQECKANGAKVVTKTIDVREQKSLRVWIEKQDTIVPFDLVIANAGISNGGKEKSEEFDREIFAVNLFGVLNTVYPAIDLMKSRKKGQIAIMSSMAGLYGFPRSPAYSSSKAAVKAFGESMRNRLRPFRIKVSVICPGFIKTPLTDTNEYKMPFLTTTAKAVQIIQRGLAKNKGIIAFPWQMNLFMWILRVLPASWSERIARFVK
jgi:short-subunit dehydrogenase